MPKRSARGYSPPQREDLSILAFSVKGGVFIVFDRKTRFSGFSECHKRILKDALSAYSDSLFEKVKAISEDPSFSTNAVLQEQYDEYMAEMRIADSLCMEVLKLLVL